MDSSQILSIFLRGALGSRGRKRARRAASFLGGNGGFLTASTVLGAAGVAWGIYDATRGAEHGPDVGATQGPFGGAQQGPDVGANKVRDEVRQQGAAPPPLPSVIAAAGGEDTGFSDDVLRIVRLAVSAARADGTLLPAERALILSHARDAGVETVVEQELAAPRALRDIVAGIADDQRKRDLYILAFAIVRADESVSGAERVYLAQLAHQLALAPSTVATLERQTAASIDAADEA